KELTPSGLAVERAEFAAEIRKPQVIECTHGLLANELTNGSLKQTNHAPRATIRARPVPATPTSSVFCRNSRQQTSYLSLISRHRWAHGTCGQTEPLAYPGNATRQAVLIKRTTLGASAHRASALG